MTDVTTEPVVTWTAEGPAFLVRLANPPANQLGPPLIDGLSAAVSAFEASLARALIVHSALGGFFVAGGDIKYMAAADRAAFEAYGASLRAVFDRIAGLDRPAIAAIEGRALGGGLELALACTMRIGSVSARVGLPEVKLGLIPGGGGTQRLPRLVGEGRARELNLTGDPIAADEAYALGLANRVVADEELFDAALAWARRLSEQAPLAVEQIKRVSAAGDIDEGIAREKEGFLQVFFSEDAREGISAFVEKRKAQFRGE
jgi:enoyl-CoA hydratase/carnithine racemase